MGFQGLESGLKELFCGVIERRPLTHCRKKAESRQAALKTSVGGVRSLDVSEERDGHEGRVRSQEWQDPTALGCRSCQSIRLRERGMGAQGTVGAQGAEAPAPPQPQRGHADVIRTQTRAQAKV